MKGKYLLPAFFVISACSQALPSGWTFYSSGYQLIEDQITLAGTLPNNTGSTVTFYDISFEKSLACTVGGSNASSAPWGFGYSPKVTTTCDIVLDLPEVDVPANTTLYAYAVYDDEFGHESWYAENVEEPHPYLPGGIVYIGVETRTRTWRYAVGGQFHYVAN